MGIIQQAEKTDSAQQERHHSRRSKQTDRNLFLCQSKIQLKPSNQCYYLNSSKLDLVVPHYDFTMQVRRKKREIPDNKRNSWHTTKAVLSTSSFSDFNSNTFSSIQPLTFSHFLINWDGQHMEYSKCLPDITWKIQSLIKLTVIRLLLRQCHKKTEYKKSQKNLSVKIPLTRLSLQQLVLEKRPLPSPHQSTHHNPKHPLCAWCIYPRQKNIQSTQHIP